MAALLKARLSLLLVGASALSCALDLEASGAGKACTASGRCAPGYVCGQDGRCTLAAPVSDPEAGPGQGGSGGSARHDAGGGAAGGDSAGSGPSPDAATEIDGPIDAGVEDRACGEPVSYFKDDDGDGFGRTDSLRSACTRPSSGWTIADGDCDDQNAAVFPGQDDYFGVAYSRPDGDSFDYDCSGSEDPDPSGAARAPDCGALGVLDCRGSGFAGTGRTGNGVNPICGSQQRIECSAALLACGATQSNAAPARCR